MTFSIICGVEVLKDRIAQVRFCDYSEDLVSLCKLNLFSRLDFPEYCKSQVKVKNDKFDGHLVRIVNHLILC